MNKKLFISLQRYKTKMRMRNKYLSILFLSLTLGFVTPKASAENRIEIIENDQQLNIYVTGNVLHIIGGNGQVMELYNVAGMKIKTVTIEGNDRHFSMNLTRGCYIVKVGNVVRKISVK